MTPRTKSREQDEMFLDWLALMDAGVSSYQVALRYGVAASRVRTIKRRITADYEASEA